METIGAKTLENDNAEPQKTGWEEVAAMADKMPYQAVAEEFDDENYDGIVDTSGRKYQDIEARANDINPENTREYGGLTAENKTIRCCSRKTKIWLNYTRGVLTEFPERQNIELVNFDTRQITFKSNKKRCFHLC